MHAHPRPAQTHFEKSDQPEGENPGRLHQRAVTREIRRSSALSGEARKRRSNLRGPDIGPANFRMARDPGGIPTEHVYDMGTNGPVETRRNSVTLVNPHLRDRIARIGAVKDP